MGILTSMFTAVTGLSSYGNATGVIGNNIANVGTAGFKSSRATFSDFISSSMAGGAGVIRSDSVCISTMCRPIFPRVNDHDREYVRSGHRRERILSSAQRIRIRVYTRAGQFKVDSVGVSLTPAAPFARVPG